MSAASHETPGFHFPLAKSFAGMTEAARQRLIAKATDLADGKIEYFKCPVTA